MFPLKLFLFSYLKGFNLLELAAHLEENTAQLRHEGLGRIKIALASTDTSSLLEILERYFGHMDMDISESTISNENSEKKATIEEETFDIPEKIPATLSSVGGLATTRLVFPLKVHPHCYCWHSQTIFTVSWPNTIFNFYLAL